jgi:hypothetical protein
VNDRSASRAAALAAAAFVSCASAQHLGDIGLRVAAGAVETLEVSASGYGEPRRVFGGAFGDTGTAWFTSNPGYDAPVSAFPVGTRLGIRFTGPILAWDGDSFEPTSPAGALAGERLRLSYLTLNATSGAGPVAGFDLAVQSDGGWHRHLSMTLLPATGAAAPDAGVYLVPLQAYSTASGVAASAEYWLVLNGGDTPENYAAAFAAAEAAMNPPACAADLDGDGAVGGADLGLLLGNWGLPGVGDLNGSGAVDGADLGALLGKWGACP